MATIPVSNFGTSVASAGPMMRETRSKTAGAAIAGVGNTILDQGIKDEEQRRKAAASLALAKTNNELHDAADEISKGVLEGTVSTKDALGEYKKRSAKIQTDNLAGLTPDFQESLRTHFIGANGQLERGLGGVIEKRNQSDTRATIVQFGEQVGREAMRNGPAWAAEKFGALVDFSGNSAGMTPAEQAEVKQRFTEKAHYDFFDAAVTGARRSNKELSEVEKKLNSDAAGAMDPRARTELLTKVEGFKFANDQRDEAARRRLEAEQERYLTKARHEFDAATSIINTGKMLSPAYVEQVTTAVRGTPYERAFKELTTGGQEKFQFGSMSLAQQEKALNQARANLNVNGTSPEAEKQVRQLESINDAAKKEYADDPLPAAASRGVLAGVAPLDMTSPASIVATIDERVSQAELVAQKTGAPVSPFLRSEADKIAKMVAALPVDQRSSALAQFAEKLGPGQAAALGRQIAPSDKATAIALGLSSARTTTGRYTSEIVLRGAQAMKDKAVQPDNMAVTGIRARAAAEIGNAFINETVRQTMIDAAVFAEYGLQSEGSGDLSRAVRLVTGAIVERGGRKVPAPYGMPAADFEKKVAQLGPESLRTAVPNQQVWIAGTSLTLPEFFKQVPNAALLWQSNGRYAVQAGTGVATNADGVPLILEVQ